MVLYITCRGKFVVILSFEVAKLERGKEKVASKRWLVDNSESQVATLSSKPGE